MCMGLQLTLLTSFWLSDLSLPRQSVWIYLVPRGGWPDTCKCATAWWLNDGWMTQHDLFIVAPESLFRPVSHWESWLMYNTIIWRKVLLLPISYNYFCHKFCVEAILRSQGRVDSKSFQISYQNLVKTAFGLFLKVPSNNPQENLSHEIWPLGVCQQLNVTDRCNVGWKGPPN